VIGRFVASALAGVEGGSHSSTHPRGGRSGLFGSSAKGKGQMER